MKARPAPRGILEVYYPNASVPPIIRAANQSDPPRTTARNISRKHGAGACEPGVVYARGRMGVGFKRAEILDDAFMGLVRAILENEASSRLPRQVET